METVGSGSYNIHIYWSGSEISTLTLSRWCVMFVYVSLQKANCDWRLQIEVTLTIHGADGAMCG